VSQIFGASPHIDTPIYRQSNYQIVKPVCRQAGKLIPEATDREPTFLLAAAPGPTATAVIQEAEPGKVRTALRRTPPVTVAANGAECTTVVTETARKT